MKKLICETVVLIKGLQQSRYNMHHGLKIKSSNSVKHLQNEAAFVCGISLTVEFLNTVKCPC